MKLFVSGVPPSMKKDDLLRIFQERIDNIETFPKDVVITCITTHPGFGFIYLTNITEEQIQGQEEKLIIQYDDRMLCIKIAEDKEKHKKKMIMNKDLKILITNLDESVTTFMIEEYFSTFGIIEQAYVAFHPKTNKPKGFGFVTFKEEEAVNKVLIKKFHHINGFPAKANRNKRKSECW